MALTRYYSFSTSDGRKFHSVCEPVMFSTNISVEFTVLGPQTNATLVFHLSEHAASRIRGYGPNYDTEGWLASFGNETIINTLNDGQTIIDGNYYLTERHTTAKGHVGSRLSDLAKGQSEE